MLDVITQFMDEWRMKYQPRWMCDPNTMARSGQRGDLHDTFSSAIEPDFDNNRQNDQFQII